MAFTSHFSIENLPYGIASTVNGDKQERAVVTRLEDSVIFLSDLNLETTDNVKRALSRVCPSEIVIMEGAALTFLLQSQL